MLKVIHNIREFIDAAGNVDKIIAVLFSAIYSTFHFLFGPIIASPYIISIISLIALDTLLGTYDALYHGKFKTVSFLKKLLKKLVEYVIYFYVALLITKAPLTVIVVPIASLVYTYMILREGTSVLKIASRVFSNKHIEAISETAEDSLDAFTGKNNDTSQ